MGKAPPPTKDSSPESSSRSYETSEVDHETGGMAVQDHLPLTKEQRTISHTLQAQAPKPESPVIPSRLPPAEISRGTAFFALEECQ